jgi:hypothetical protein
MTNIKAPASNKARRFNWPRIFGYDFFISFKLGPLPIGAQSYASDLASRLRELDFTVFYSEESAFRSSFGLSGVYLSGSVMHGYKFHKPPKQIITILFDSQLYFN